MFAPLIAALVLAVAPGFQLEDGASPTASPRSERAEAWNALGQQERERLLERYERLQRLEPAERERVLDRAARLQQEVERTRESLTLEERAQIEALDPRERRRVLRGLLAERARAATNRLRSRIDDEERQELEAADSEERPAIVKRIQREQRARFAEELGRDLGLNERELRRVRTGTRDERRGALVAAARRSSARYVESHGLPPEVSEETWSRVSTSNDRVFVRGYLRLRAQHPEFGIPPKVWERRSRRRGAMATRLDALARPSTALRARFPESSEKELRRRAILDERSRIEDFVIRRAGVGEAGGERLRGLSDEAFVRLVVGASSALRRGGDLASEFARRTKEAESMDDSSRRRSDRRGGDRPRRGPR